MGYQEGKCIMLARITINAAAALVMAGPGWSQSPATEEAKLIASDAAAFEQFGSSVSLAGDTAVVGASVADHSGFTNAGAAYVFVRSGTTWGEQKKLTASDASSSDYFGCSVSMARDTAVVGAWSDDFVGGLGDEGSAYVFVRNGANWTAQQKLTASDAGDDDSFGWSVSIEDDTAVVGSYRDDHSGLVNAGSAYVFVRNGGTWGEQQKLTASQASDGDNFGESVAISGDTLVIGAPVDTFFPGASGGAAHVFVRNGMSWSEQQKLTASDASASDHFGYSVSIAGDIVVVGAYSDDHSGWVDAGSAYVFVRNGTTWSELQKLTASDPASADYFGLSVNIAGDTAVVGSSRDDHSGWVDAGSAYVFAQSGTTWIEQQKLMASDAAASDRFGISVSLAGETTVVGAYLADPSGIDTAGAAYVFDISTSVAYCTAGTSASGCQALLSATGSPSASALSGFTLSAATVEGQKDGLFFFGTNGQQANPWGNSTSYQCVVPPVVRTPTTAGTGTIGLCDGSFALDLNALWCPTCPKPAKNPGPAATVQAQLWYRDPLSTSNQTTSLSDAIEFVVAP